MAKDDIKLIAVTKDEDSEEIIRSRVVVEFDEFLSVEDTPEVVKEFVGLGADQKVCTLRLTFKPEGMIVEKEFVSLVREWRKYKREVKAERKSLFYGFKGN